MLAFAVTAALILALAGLGRPLAWRLGTCRNGQHLTEAELWALAPLLGALPLAVLVQVVGAWRYDPLSMAVTLAVALLPALAFLRLRPFVPVLPWWPWGWMLAVLVGLMAVSALAPPLDHDSIRYHLTLPRRDLELGRIGLWFGWSIYEFFPPLTALLTRLAYALGGAAAAQMLNVFWVVMAALWAGLLARRLGLGPQGAMAAALLFVSQRVVLNLGAAVTTDIPLAAFIGAFAAVAVAGTEGARRALLLGLLLGAAMATKYQGIVAAVAMMTPLAVLALLRRRGLPALILAGSVALLVLSPILLRNFWITGNPVFPTAHPLFGADNLDIFAPFTQAMAARSVVPGGLAALPWTMFILQDAFDGLQFGFPILLLGLPFAFFRHQGGRALCLVGIVIYTLVWWGAMPHLLRFLQPIFVPLAALAAAGLVEVAVVGRRIGWFRPVFAASVGVAIGIQALFAGSSALYRLPVALGLADIRSALEVPAFQYYGLITPCLWLQDNLRPGERYVAVINDPSVYCPQAPTLHPLGAGEAARFYSRGGLPALSAAQVAEMLRGGNVRYVLVANNPGTDDETYAFAKHRFDAVLLPILRQQKPLVDSASGKIYDALAVLAALESGIGAAEPASGR
ncbi:glycosyltransferase family 39 protein [Magnetospirillum sulfuroxidans]|uniref:Glycosyltransferase RgtA/B/C/D-like domain-containing protein n=1 Tax=Magnetospirillum sulfuroxidans TaxID=611300 RepID=A0ABS5IE92_9PROT|nr:glycosyltransferase family 39 protein [Magnetospirillum sulfuroxidans]MBR9972742.1 hypothetical protein [Magnetospirillum sulfuroxidans]